MRLLEIESTKQTKAARLPESQEVWLSGTTGSAGEKERSSTFAGNGLSFQVSIRAEQGIE